MVNMLAWAPPVVDAVAINTDPVNAYVPGGSVTATDVGIGVVPVTVALPVIVEK